MCLSTVFYNIFRHYPVFFIKFYDFYKNHRTPFLICRASYSLGVSPVIFLNTVLK